VATENDGRADRGAIGLRTFMIADVRGYTAYTRTEGDEAAGRLAETFAAEVRGVVEARGGRLLELRGDEALVVFESPRQALRAAVALQTRIDEIHLPRGVGIGLDAGEAVAVEGGFRGGALNLAARLCAEARAGEILASETVIHLAARIEGLEYVDARTISLKGYDEPVRAVEVISSDRVRRGLSRRVRRARRRFSSHRRVAVGSLVLLLVTAGALVTYSLLQSRPAATLADLSSGTVLLDATTGLEIAEIPATTIKAPVEAFYAEGDFWVLNLEPLSLIEIDGKTGAIVRQLAGFVNEIGGQTVDGTTLWQASYSQPLIVKIDIPSNREVARYDLTEATGLDDGFAALVIGAGSLWALAKDSGEVLRIDPTDGAILARVKDVLSWGGAFGDDALWTTAFAGMDRIDAATNKVQHTDVPDGTVGGAAVGAGFVWTTDDRKGVVFKVNRGGAVVATYETGLGARGASYADGRLWVANQDIGTVSGIDGITGDVRTLTFGHPIQAISAGGGSVLALLSEGRSYEDRIDELTGTVARIFTGGYQFEGDPATAQTSEALLIERATCSGLVGYPDIAGSYEIQPELAAQMPTVSADLRTYTFEVRSGFRFSEPSGEPITAETFRYSIERALSPRLGAGTPAGSVLSSIEGEAPFRAGTIEHISGITANGNTLSITLIAPSGALLAALAMPYFCPVPVTTPFVANALWQKVSTPTGEVTSMASSGPYYVYDAINGEYVILRRNLGYIGDRPHAFDAIALREGVSGGLAVSRVQNEGWDGIVELSDEIFDPSGELARLWGPRSSPAAAGDQRYYPVAGGASAAFFAPRIGCLVFDPQGTLNLAALCLKP
jgi:class 3 adenylate cyclase